MSELSTAPAPSEDSFTHAELLADYARSKGMVDLYLREHLPNDRAEAARRSAQEIEIGTIVAEIDPKRSLEIAKTLIAAGTDVKLTKVVEAAHRYDPAATVEFVREQFAALRESDKPPHHLIAQLSEIVAADDPALGMQTLDFLATNVEVNALNILSLGLDVAMADDTTRERIATHIRSALRVNNKSSDFLSTRNALLKEYLRIGTQDTKLVPFIVEALDAELALNDLLDISHAIAPEDEVAALDFMAAHAEGRRFDYGSVERQLAKVAHLSAEKPEFALDFLQYFEASPAVQKLTSDIISDHPDLLVKVLENSSGNSRVLEYCRVAMAADPERAKDVLAFVLRPNEEKSVQSSQSNQEKVLSWAAALAPDTALELSGIDVPIEVIAGIATVDPDRAIQLIAEHNEAIDRGDIEPIIRKRGGYGPSAGEDFVANKYYESQIANALSVGLHKVDPERAQAFDDKNHIRRAETEADREARMQKFLQDVADDPKRLTRMLDDHWRSDNVGSVLRVVQEVDGGADLVMQHYYGLERGFSTQRADMPLLTEIAAQEPKYAARIFNIISFLSERTPERYTSNGYRTGGDYIKENQVAKAAAHTEIFQELMREHPLELLTAISETQAASPYKRAGEQMELAQELVASCHGLDAERTLQLVREAKGVFAPHILAAALEYDSSLIDLAKEVAVRELAGEQADLQPISRIIDHMMTQPEGIEPITSLLDETRFAPKFYLLLPHIAKKHPPLQEYAGGEIALGLRSATDGWSFRMPNGLAEAAGEMYFLSEAASSSVDDFIESRYSRSSDRNDAYWRDTAKREILRSILLQDSDKGAELAVKHISLLDDYHMRQVLEKGILESGSSYLDTFLDKIGDRSTTTSFFNTILKNISKTNENGPLLYRAVGEAVLNYDSSEVQMRVLEQILPHDRSFAAEYMLLVDEGERPSQGSLAPLIAAVELATKSPTALQVGREVMGERSGIVEPFSTERDRSLNFNLITSEMIWQNGRLIDLLVSQTATVEEFKALVRHLDSLFVDDMIDRDDYGQPPKRAEVFEQAIWSAIRLKQFDGMKSSYREQIQLKAQDIINPITGQPWEVEHGLFAQLPNIDLLARICNYNVTDLLETAFTLGYNTDALIDHPWLLNRDVLRIAEPFPHNGSKPQKHNWLAEHAFVRLEGFNKSSIGQIIGNRLANNIEESLHDASEWLTTFAIKEDQPIGVYNPETGSIEQKVVSDLQGERTLVTLLMHPENFSASIIRRLPSFEYRDSPDDINIDRLKTIFNNPLNAIAYAGIIRCLRKQDLENLRELSVDEVMAEIDKMGEVIHGWLGDSKEITKREFGDRELRIIREILSDFGPPFPDVGQTRDQQINHQISSLKSVGKDRKAYVDGTTNWLRRYQNISANTLTRAWGDRAIALEAGVEDDPQAILNWAKENAFLIMMRERVAEKAELERIMREYDDVIRELTSRYPAETVLRAVQRLDKEISETADFVPAEIDLGEGFVLKVFDKHDAAGFTIGKDTDCCMTLGGVSESCIWAGYTDPRAGFIGLYENGQLLSQSFIWHNQGENGPTLVLDNIEAQRGRSVERIAELNRRGLEVYLAHLLEARPDLGIRSANLGTGYLQHGIAERLAAATPVRLPFGDYVYSDADRQLALVTPLDDERVEQIMAESTDSFRWTEQVRPSKEPRESASFPLLSSDEQMVEMVALLERQIYPDAIRTGVADIAEELSRSDNFSFTILKEGADSAIVGYMMAYYDESRGGIYVSDLAILPEQQRGGYGARAFVHLLQIADDQGIDRIEFEARESTSYPALLSESATAILNQFDCEITSVIQQDVYDNGEKMYLVTIQKR